MKLMLFDTLSGKQVEFSLQKQQKINLYVCGITPYDYSHLGHGRSYVCFDVLFRFLKFCGFDVNFVRNFTDIDDKLLKKAEMILGDSSQFGQVAKQYISDYHTQMKKLNNLPPSHEPLVTESISAIIELIEELIRKDFAYKSGNDVFFRIDKFSAYGKLSKKNKNELLAGSRININESKENPLDFVLWKGEAAGAFWDASFGPGRPGWHIECSAMIAKHCGGTVDIHGGGADLIFPHHENEIAQSESSFGKPLAKAWMHNGFISIDKEKMSKSLGNSIAMKDYFEIFSPADFRFYILQHHYRSPIDFSEEKILAAREARKTLCNLAGLCKKENLEISEESHFSTFFRNLESFPQEIKNIANDFLNALQDDLNTAKALGILFKNINLLKTNLLFSQQILGILQFILGINLNFETEPAKEIPEEIQKLFKLRNEARLRKDWKLADSLREQIISSGHAVIDKKNS